MLASESVQKSRNAHTNATELRETRLAITENTEKKDAYLSLFHVNQLMVCEDKLFGSILRNMFGWKRRKQWEFSLHYYQDTRPCHTICSILRSHYTTIYEYIRKDGTM